jgi:RimJ/RimL family protein N-acetyltransferase
VNLIETDRLALRRLTVGDAGFLLALLNDATFVRFVGDRGIRDVSAAATYLANGPLASYERFGFGLCLVTLKSGDLPIGICGLLKRDTLDDVDLGFAFMPQFRARGFAFEAATATLAYARNGLGLTRIVAITSPENSSSMRLLKKLGLRYEKTVQLSPDAPTLNLFALDFRPKLPGN